VKLTGLGRQRSNLRFARRSDKDPQPDSTIGSNGNATSAGVIAEVERAGTPSTSAHISASVYLF